jgi:nucleotide-binding universal stress UspA family protein
MDNSVRRRLRILLARRRYRLARAARRTLARGYRTIVVPLLDGPETERALQVACRLAAGRGARILLLAPLLVEPELPLDAHFADEERELHVRLERERALVESYGVAAKTRIARARAGELGRTVAKIADEERATLVMVGAEAGSPLALHRPAARDVRSILRDAPCRVLLLDAAPALVAAERAA